MRYGVKMPLLQGGFIGVDVPGPHESRASAEEIFEQGCRDISKEYAVRHKASREAASSWLQQVCYGYLSNMVDHGLAALFEERIDRLGRDVRGQGRHVNPFARGLLAVFAHEKGYADDGDRHRLGGRLWYAYRHYVPAPFLLGFLHQVWDKEAPERAARNEVEPEFEEWIWIKRAEDPAPHLRGEYPTRIEKSVSTFTFLSPIVGEYLERSDRLRQQRRLRDQEK